jgi:hypothetical protein
MIDEKTAQDLMFKQLTIEWPETASIALFINNATVQFDGNVVYLSFFQINPPLIIGETEQGRQQFEQMSTIKALPVVKLALTVEVYRRLMQVLQENLNRIEKIISESTSSTTN